MKWTNERPREPGLYWFQLLPSTKPQLIKIEGNTGEPQSYCTMTGHTSLWCLTDGRWGDRLDEPDGFEPWEGDVDP